MATAPAPIDALPAAPNPDSPEATFDAAAYAWSAALPAWTTQANALGGTTYANAAEATAAAETATAQAGAAVAAVNATLWVSGTTYAAGTAVYSPITLGTYRTLTSGISSFDPSLQPARWLVMNGGATGVPDFLLHAQGII